MPTRQAPSSGDPAGPVTRTAPRQAQRRRTRAAIVEATQRLVRSGSATPSVDEIAAAADVSRRTVYMYFPTLDQLLLDAAVGSLSTASVDNTFAATADSDPDERVDRLIRAILSETAATLPLGRQIIRLTIDAPAGAGAPRRGYRRVEWLERALEPLRDQLTTEQFDRLVSALALITGWEAMIVLRDIRALDPAAEQDVTTWAARALIDAARREAVDPDSER